MHPVIHFEFGGPDGAELATFYEKLFGWEAMPTGHDYWLLSPGDGGIGGGVLQTSDDMPPYVTVYVEVDDLVPAIEQAESLGASLTVPPTQVPGVGAFALVRDPAGNLVGLMEELHTHATVDR
jgi:predicted enzyme related to lactoylglutathione lyase